MDTIAEFIAALNFKVDTRELTEAEKKAREAAEKSAKAWGKFGDTIRNVGLGALGAAGGMLALVERSAASAAAIDDVAKRTGAATRDLQRLKFAAEQSGSSFGAVEGALKALDRALVKGAKDTGPAAEALRALGLTTTQLIDLPAEAKFATIADAIAKVENPALQTKIAMDLFGGSGAELVPVLAEGSAGIRALGDEAEKAGLVLSDAAINGAAKFDDELGKAKAQIGAVSRDIGLALLPAVREGIKHWGDWVQVVVAFGIALGSLKLVKAAADFGVVGDKLAAINWAAGVAGAASLGFALGKALDNALGLSDALANVNQLETQRGAPVALSDLTDDERARLQDATARRDKFRKLSEESVGAFSEPAVEATNAAQREIDAIQNGARGRARGRKQFEDATAAVDTFVARDKGERAIDRAAKSNEALNRRARKLGKKKGGSKKAFEADISAEQIEFDEVFGDELRRLAARNGVGEIAVDAALKAGAEAVSSGAADQVAKDAALSVLGQRAGKDFGRTKTKDPLLSQIFGDENVPDVELSSIARGAEPQVLISNITNTFNFDIAQNIDGTGDPREVANRAAAAFRDFSRGSIEQATKTAKVAFAR